MGQKRDSKRLLHPIIRLQAVQPFEIKAKAGAEMPQEIGVREYSLQPLAYRICGAQGMYVGMLCVGLLCLNKNVFYKTM
jgi:hypothetical protein